MLVIIMSLWIKGVHEVALDALARRDARGSVGFVGGRKGGAVGADGGASAWHEGVFRAWSWLGGTLRAVVADGAGGGAGGCGEGK